MASGPPDFSTTRMQELADKAVKEKAGVISRMLQVEQLHITCRSHTPFDSDNSGLIVFFAFYHVQSEVLGRRNVNWRVQLFSMRRINKQAWL